MSFSSKSRLAGSSAWSLAERALAQPPKDGAAQYALGPFARCARTYLRG